VAERKLEDWLSAHLEYTENSESPLSYHTWAGVSCIAAVLQRRVYMNWESQIFPNNYIMLIGPSGRSRKAHPLEVVKDYLDETNVIMMSENPTPEAFIVDMHKAENQYLDETTGNWVYQSPVSCVVEELAVMLGQQNVQFLSFLTNWYDSRYKWVRRTKHQGTDIVLGVCLNILGSSAPDWLPGILTREAIGGGFTSRCIFVVEERKRKTVLDPTVNRPDPKLRGELIHDLELMMCLSGEYILDPECREFYIEWYGSEEEKLQSGKLDLGDPALMGYAARRPTHLRKISMAMAASRGDEMVIYREDMERALSILVAAERNMHMVFSGIGRNKWVAETELVMKYIKNRGTCLKSELLAHLYRDISEEALETIINVLVAMKRVKLSLLIKEGDVRYAYKAQASDEDSSLK
jgi:hypothetical protein